MAHIVCPEAEAILDKEHPVLDKGFVRLVDYLGGDARIVQAARVSYGAGTKTVREDKGLIHYLIRISRHMVPEFNAKQMSRADRALWQGKPVPGGGEVNERGTMYPFADLPDLALLRAD